MNIKKIILAGAAAATLIVAGATGAGARPWVRDSDHDGRPDGSWAERHDSRKDWYRNHGYDHPRARAAADRRMISHDRVYGVVRAHHYRYIGAPYWYRGYYGVRAYDPYGKVVFVRVDPYAGSWMGVAFRF
jgi:hypothetical protein